MLTRINSQNTAEKSFQFSELFTVHAKNRVERRRRGGVEVSTTSFQKVGLISLHLKCTTARLSLSLSLSLSSAYWYLRIIDNIPLRLSEFCHLK